MMQNIRRILFGATFSGLFLFSSASAAPWPGFQDYDLIDLGNTTFQLAAGDLNSDGLIDFLGVHQVPDKVNLSLSNGNGGYSSDDYDPVVQIDTGDAPNAPYLHDLNLDGILDILTSNSSDPGISVLLGNGTAPNGDGTFSAVTNYSVVGGSQGVAIADFDSDGFPDIATISSEVLYILLGEDSSGTATGTFAAPLTFPATGTNPRALIAEDFNDDGILDLASADYLTPGIVSIFIGGGTAPNGDGTFGLPTSFPVGNRAIDLLSKDFNDDGISDIAVTNQFSTEIAILIGNGSLGVGDGTFSSAVFYPIPDQPFDIKSEDFNEDGIFDLVVGSDGEHVYVLLGNGTAGSGDGTFASPVGYKAGNLPISLAVNDANGDGILDLHCLNNEIVTLYGNGSGGVGDGTFTEEIRYNGGGEQLVLADLNDDGALDILAATSLFADVSLVNTGGDIASNIFEPVVSNFPQDSPDSITVNDFTGDGVLDFASLGFFSSRSIFIGNEVAGIPDGTFAPAVSETPSFPPVVHVSGDFDEDTIVDLVTFGFSDYRFSPGIGDGTFGSETILSGSFATFDTPIVGDFNSDDFLDIIGFRSADDDIFILLGNGDGTFASSTTSVGDAPSGIATADFNADGRKDLVVSNANDDNVHVLFGNGSGIIANGTFTLDAIYPVGENPSSVVVNDFDSDGIQDIATLDVTDGTVSVLIGNGTNGVGDGTFASAIKFNVPFSGTTLGSSDLDQNGAAEIIVSTNRELLILENLGEPALALDSNSINFGNVELGSGAANLSLQIENVGTAYLETSSTLTLDGGGTYTLSSIPLTTLFVDSFTTVGLSFLPTAIGPFAGELQVASNTTSGTITIPITATAVDTQEPTSTATAPTGVISQASPIFNVEYTSSDNAGGSGVASVELFYQLEGGGYTSYGSFTSSPISFDTTGTGGNGSYDFYTVSTDVASNVETKTPTAEITVTLNDTTSAEDWLTLDNE